MQESSTRKIYNTQSKFYDVIARHLVIRRQRTAIEQMGIEPGQHILDIGVGTGLSLLSYPDHAKVVGLDLSEGMLSKAASRIRRHRIANAQLVRGNAMSLPFEDNRFDHVLVSHVVTVVSDPVTLIDEIRRVGKPGCWIVIINRFRSSNPFWAAMDRIFNPFFERIGWRSNLCFQELRDLTDLNVEFRYRLDRVDFWQTIFAVNSNIAAA
jgi:phosphatidylethanolamine/phosphatidyl-N-methylethanolamine N-methyltransferase